jgi:hypothetical protein
MRWGKDDVGAADPECPDGDDVDGQSVGHRLQVADEFDELGRSFVEDDDQPEAAAVQAVGQGLAEGGDVHGGGLVVGRGGVLDAALPSPSEAGARGHRG